MRRLLLSLLLALSFLGVPMPAAAAVTITFWSHDQDENFPHAFFALKGTPDAGGAPIDANYGFTAKAITPAILIGTVGGKVEDNKPAYMRRSDARFSLTLTDAQYADIRALIDEWQAKSGYNLNKRNCVHFVAEAARRAGLTVPDLPKLMKKPKSFLVAVGEANVGRVTPLNMDGRAYFAAYGEPGGIVAASAPPSPATPAAPATPGGSLAVSPPAEPR